jgi:hypothetical protein
VNTSPCILYVPNGSKALYQAAPFWGSFTNIQVIITTGAEAFESENIKIFPTLASDCIQVVGIKSNSHVSIINVNGQTVFTQKIDNDKTVAISSLPRGIYFVKINTSKGVFSQKIMKN